MCVVFRYRSHLRDRRLRTRDNQDFFELLLKKLNKTKNILYPIPSIPDAPSAFHGGKKVPDGYESRRNIRLAAGARHADYRAVPG